MVFGFGGLGMGDRAVNSTQVKRFIIAAYLFGVMIGVVAGYLAWHVPGRNGCGWLTAP
jgi:hypothetical protein